MSGAVSTPGYALLSGGVGGAKLALGLQQVLEPGQLQVVVNTGDDFNHLGLLICPDLDTLLYTLADRANPDTGWGRRDESWACLEALAELGGPDWFRLGDRDLATHLLRRAALAEGQSLTDVTQQLCRALDVPTPLRPMSDTPVRTEIHTAEGTLAFQDYFVRLGARPVAQGFSYRGADTAAPAPQALRALETANAIIIAPSNPWLSIAPILSLPAIGATIEKSTAPVIAVAPVIAGQAVKGPTAKLMQELGIEPGVVGIARHYGALLDGLIIDRQDAARQNAIEALGIKVAITDTLMTTLDDKTRLAQRVLEFAQQLRAGGSA